jgi:hypothetical protein
LSRSRGFGLWELVLDGERHIFVRSFDLWQVCTSDGTEYWYLVCLQNKRK